VIYIDDSDGDRVSQPERQDLYRAGIDLGLDDAMPDVLLAVGGAIGAGAAAVLGIDCELKPDETPREGLCN